MESRAHAAAGAAVSFALVVVLWPTAGPEARTAIRTYGVAVSVLVDLDHFVVARVVVGDWRHLRRVLARPTGALWGQTWIFDDVDSMELERLSSHALVSGLLVAGLWPAAPTLATFTAAVLYVHVLADLLRDNEVVRLHNMRKYSYIGLPFVLNHMNVY